MHLRDLNLLFEGDKQMTVNTCVETVRSLHDPWNHPPVTFLFMDKGGLATHPLSYHPQGYLAGEKIRENERK